MCSYLERQLNIEPGVLEGFEVRIRRGFKGTGPYPTYVLPSPARSHARSPAEMDSPPVSRSTSSRPLTDSTIVAGVR